MNFKKEEKRDFEMKLELDKICPIETPETRNRNNGKCS